MQIHSSWRGLLANGTTLGQDATPAEPCHSVLGGEYVWGSLGFAGPDRRARSVTEREGVRVGGE